MNNASSSKFGFLFFLVLAAVGYFALAGDFRDNEPEYAEESYIEVDVTEEKEYEGKHQRSANDPTFTETFSMNRGNLSVLTSGGKISVEGGKGSKVEVEVFVRQNGKILSNSHKLVKDLDKGFDMKIEKNGSTVYAHAKRKDRGMPWKRVSIAFHVSVPQEMSCDLKTSGGSISLEDVEGDQLLKTSGGSIHLTHIDGAVEAKTSGGSIHVEDVDGEVLAHTSGGSIKVAGNVGNVEAHTSGGRISLDDVDGNNIDARTSGGSISINGSAKSLSASTSGGSISAKVKGISQNLNLSTSGGSIKAEIPGNVGMDLDLKANRVDVDLQNFSGSAKKHSVQGAMNGGGMPVTMKTTGGSISIAFN